MRALATPVDQTLAPASRLGRDTFQHVALDLAVRVSRNALHFYDVKVAKLKPAERVSESLDKLAIAALRVRYRDADLFDSVRIGNRADADVADVGGSQDQLFQPVRRELVPADVQEIVASPEVLQPVCVMENAEVPGVEPSIPELAPGGFGIVEIVVDHAIRLDPDLAHLTERQGTMVLVDDLDADSRQHGSELGASSGGGNVGRLVGAIEIAEIGRQTCEDFTPQRTRDGRPPGENRQISRLLETARQRVKHILHRDWREGGVRDRMRGYRLLERHPALDHDRSA